MLKFAVYLVESGLCLAILYTVYSLFFRKETYFRFNRFYLLGMIVLSLCIPMLHLSINLQDYTTIKPAFKEIGRFRNYYERLITMSDPDLGTYYDHGLPRAVFEDQWGQIHETATPVNLGSGTLNSRISAPPGKTENLSLLQWLLLVYLIGILFFFLRFVFLISKLIISITRHQVVKRSGVHLVLLKKETPPFSFFRYVFISEKVANLPECDQILLHEKAHIEQKHSFDLVVAQILVIFQWYNPLVWTVLKSIKINHEFLADSHVIKSGYTLFDYQSLLLSQLISINSVELVNNFNLLSIKKRITMMTQIKSGLKAKMKAIVIIPTALLLLFVFADLTISSPDLRFANYTPIAFRTAATNLDGLWKTNEGFTAYSLLSFKKNKLQILESKTSTRTYDFKSTSRHLEISTRPGTTIKIRYEKEGDELTVWWKPDAPTKYTLTKYHNSLEIVQSQIPAKIQLPTIKHTRQLDNSLCISISMNKEQLFVNQTSCSMTDFESVLQEQKKGYFALDAHKLTVKLFIDKHTPMSKVSELYETLRKNNLLKIAHAGVPINDEIPDLLYHTVGIPKLLPPTGPKSIIIEEDKIKKETLNVIHVDDDNNSPESIKPIIKERLDMTEHKPLVILKYSDKTEYAEYLGYIDMLYITYQELRDQKAHELYQLPFNDLSPTQQKKIRRIYPMKITEQNPWGLQCNKK